MLLSKVRQTINKYRMLSPGDRVLIAVSGGPDSVCLLSVLKELAAERDLALHVAHLDHMFRGQESAAEARFVKDLARNLGIPATVEARDVPLHCAERGISVQAGAREVRYAFLAAVAGGVGANKIAVGHTANDQAETLLMRLIRGAGVSGLSAIPPVRANIIRPLIDATRDEVLAYLRERGLRFATDSSNLKPLYTRNRVRHEVMPVLERFNPRVTEVLAAEAGLLRDEDEAMEAALAEIVPRIIRREDEGVSIARDEFNGLLPALRRRVLRKALALASAEDTGGLSSVQAEETLGFLAEAQTGRAMELPGGLVLLREYGVFFIRSRGDTAEFRVPLAVPGRTGIAERCLEVEATVHDAASGRWSSGENNLWQAEFDYDKIALPLYLRSRRRGDRFCPAGMGGRSKKLQDFFIDEKVGRCRRAEVPLLATEKDIIWVVGMRTDERFLRGSGTRKVLVVTVRNTK